MTDTLPEVSNPDWGFGETPEFRVRKVSFGDGYEQRAPDGINSTRRKWSPVWTMLSEEEKDLLYDFLLARAGVEAFMFNPPPKYAPVKALCTEVRWSYNQFNDFSVSAEFKEDFTP